jgi:hypothetical protein
MTGIFGTLELSDLLRCQDVASAIDSPWTDLLSSQHVSFALRAYVTGLSIGVALRWRLIIFFFFGVDYHIFMFRGTQLPT